MSSIPPHLQFSLIGLSSSHRYVSISCCKVNNSKLLRTHYGRFLVHPGIGARRCVAGGSCSASAPCAIGGLTHAEGGAADEAVGGSPHRWIPPCPGGRSVASRHR